MMTRLVAPVVAAACLMGAAELYRISAEARRSAQDPYRIEMQEARFAALAAVVPKSEKLGYVTDVAVDTPAGQAAYFAAQYALAPRLVVAGDPKAARAVGNFRQPPDLAALGFALERDFGNGLMLLRREGSQR